MNIYETIPVLESAGFLIRPVRDADCDDLLGVYSDRLALPFFNSDNCDGDIFCYDTPEEIAGALSFWKMSYEARWFARMAIADKAKDKVIGTVEVCTRVSDDEYNNMAILRIDVRSDYESEAVLLELLRLVTPELSGWLGSRGVITKGACYAVERNAALARAGYKRMNGYLTGKNGYPYDGYWVLSED